MLKIIVSIVLLGIMGFASDPNEATLEALGESGALIGGATGIGIIHGVFWGPLIIFSVVAGLVIGAYYKMFKQKDDGLFKTISAIALGIILGIFFYIGCLKLVDTMFDSTGCGSSIVTAYMKDSVRKGFNPTQPFGKSIKELSCLQ